MQVHHAHLFAVLYSKCCPHKTHVEHVVNDVHWQKENDATWCTKDTDVCNVHPKRFGTVTSKKYKFHLPKSFLQLFNFFSILLLKLFLKTLRVLNFSNLTSCFEASFPLD
jgi:hypothetical protein